MIDLMREMRALRAQVELLQMAERPPRGTSTTFPPSAADDTNAGYAIGSHWIDTLTDTAYVCVDATPAAAVWKQITP